MLGADPSWALGSAALLSILIILLFILRPRRLEGIPGPEPSLLFGNISEILQIGATDVFVKWTREYGRVMQYSVSLLGTQVLIADADALKRILITNCQNYRKAHSLVSVVRKIFGKRCMISLPYEEHTARRRIVSPAFKTRALMGMLPTMCVLGQNALDEWSARLARSTTNSVEVDAHEDVVKLTIDLLGKCILGHDFNCMRSSQEPITRALYKVMSVEDLSWLRMLPFYDALPTAWNKNIKAVREFATRTMQEKRAGSASESVGILDLLLKAREDDPSGALLSDSEISDDVVLFLIAGHETLSGVICWALLQIAQYPEVQEKCREESTRVLPQCADGITRDCVSKLQYCASVIKETLRLYSSVPLTVRQAVNDDVICGHFIPAGTLLTLCLSTMMRQADYYDEPECFKPERFINAEKSLPHFLPFLSGPAMCIGHKFAMMEMTVFLALVTRDFTCSSIPGMQFRGKQGLTFQMDPPLKLRISRVGGRK